MSPLVWASRQVAVVDLFAARFQGSGGQKRLGGAGGFGTGFLVTVFGRNPVVGRHPLAGALVRDDLCSRRREHFVVAGLIEVIVGVEEGLDLGAGARFFSAAITLSPDFGAPLSTSTRPSPVENASTLLPPPSTTASLSVGDSPVAR